MYTELLTEEQIREFQETARLTTLDYKTKEVSQRKFKIDINGKIYYPHNENEHILTKDQLADQTFTVCCYDFGCRIRIPNLDKRYVKIDELNADYIAFMIEKLKEIDKSLARKYIADMKQCRIEAKKARENAFKM